MANIRIITWDQKELDYISPESLNLKLNRVVDDLTNPSNRFGEYSFTFSLPITINNLEVFSYAGTPNINNNFKYNTIECSIYDDDKLIINGILELRAIKDTYECVMYSKFTQLVDNLKDKKLQDIKSLPHIVDFDYENTIIDHINSDYADCDEAKWQFPFVYYNTFYTPTGVFTGTTDQTGRDFRADTNKQNYYNLINNTTNPTPNEFYFHQFPLAWYIVPVLEGMLQDAGWTLGGSFFEDKNVKKIIMPYVGDSDVYDTASYCTDVVVSPTIVIPTEIPNDPLEYSISIIKSGSLLGNVSGYGTFPSGTVVNINASPFTGNEFIHWKYCNSDIVLSTNPSLTMIADADYCIEATFREICIAPTTTIFTPTTSYSPTTTYNIPTTQYVPPQGFMFDILIDHMPIENRTFTLPLINMSGIDYDFIVYWGDGSSNHITTYNDTNRTHTYAVVNEENYINTFSVNIVGTMEGWGVLAEQDKTSILRITNFGGSGFNGFEYLENGFSGCVNLSSVGSNPIKASGTGVGLNGHGFDSTFYNCTSLITIPYGLFDQHIGCQSFISTFENCVNLETVPNNLFRNNTADLIQFNSTFKNCYKLQINPYTFYSAGEESTRFLNKNVYLWNTFTRGTFTGNMGTAPYLWNCNYGTGSVDLGVINLPFKGDGNNPLSISNYCYIPDTWGGDGTCYTTIYSPTTTVYSPTTTYTAPTTTAYVATTTVYSPTTTYTAPTTTQAPTTLAPTTTVYSPTTTYTAPTTTAYSPTTTVYNPNGFVTEWTVFGDVTARTITLPLPNEAGINYNFIAYWGDGNSSLITSYDDADRIHTYASNGTYQVNIVGTCDGWSFNNTGDKLKITKVIDFGGSNFDGFKSLGSGFMGCSNLTSLGSNPIKPNGTGVTGGFSFCFYGCSSLTTLPTDLFRYNPNAAGSYTFYCTFMYCSNLNTIPQNTFKYNTLATNFQYTFYGCDKLQLNSYMFYAAGEQSTRFLNKSINFDNCFNRGSFTGTQGTAPELWNCNFGTGTPSHTDTFIGAGNSIASLTNYCSIASGWGATACPTTTAYSPTTTVYSPTTTYYSPTTTVYNPPTTVYDPNGFITEWAVSGDATARTITLPLLHHPVIGISPVFNYDFYINWGDGTASQHVTSYNDANATHTYASNGTYQINIVGTCECWSREYAPDVTLTDETRLLRVINFGGSAFTGFKYLRSGFAQCTNLYDLGTAAIKIHSTGMITDGFLTTFSKCTALGSLPSNLFVNDSSTYGFPYTFQGCTNLATVPSGLFRSNTNATKFTATFWNCNKLQLNQYIFYNAGEQSTRFLNKSVNFSNCFLRTSFTGTQGTAPDLWTCSFGSGTITKSGCYFGAGNSSTSLSNYASITSDWK